MDLRTIKEFIKDSLKYIIIIVIVLLLVLYVVSLQQVVGPSMSPNYRDGDILVLNKLHYRFSNPKRFDVAVIKNNDTKFFIKRVIGLPGEYVEYKDNRLYIDGEEVLEKFPREDIEDFKLEFLNYEKIPEGYYFVVGDNRMDSLDSRYSEVGLIKKEEFIGKVLFRLWPIRK